MRIAVTYDNGQVFQHFGHTEQFKLYDVEDGKVTQTTITDSVEDGHGALAEVLRRLQVDTLICGGIGGGAKQALAEAKIRLYGGVTGDADRAVANLLTDQLAFDSDATCEHHGEHHGGVCGGHNGDEHQHRCGH